MAAEAPRVGLTSTLAMVLAAEAAGADTGRLLTQAGISREMLSDPEARLPGARILALWDRLRKASGNPYLQLVAPRYLPFGAYKVIDYLVDASATVGEAFHRFARFFRLIADRVSVVVVEGDDGAYMALSMTSGAPVPPVYVDYTLAAVVGRIRLNTRRALALARVELRHEAPPDPGRYEEVFQAPVLFGATEDRIFFTREEWESPTDHGDQTLAALLEEHAEILAKRLPEPVGDFVGDVRRVVLEFLPRSPKADEVARKLSLSLRTLQRRLTEAGLTYSDVLEEVRSELAKEYLSDAEVGISEVAFLLGFSEQSSFHRAFRRWTGIAPGRWRGRAPIAGRS